MNKKPFLSLCIPTNGVLEWVMPVLESIYTGESHIEEFEVIVTDNGSNAEFRQAMLDFADSHQNFIYQKTDAFMFLNQIEAFKLANGLLIKFINHRMTLLPGALNYLIEFAKKYQAEQPVVYFSNGMLKLQEQTMALHSFEAYVRELSYWSSWSAGTAMWKADFNRMDLSLEFNQLFPHTDIIFFNKDSQDYIVDDHQILGDLPIDNTKKGKYDVFNAFAVEYPKIIKNLYEQKDISKSTYDYVIEQNGTFVSKLYLSYMILKQPCSYDLSGFKKAAGAFYSESKIKRGAYTALAGKAIKKVRNKTGL